MHDFVVRAAEPIRQFFRRPYCEVRPCLSAAASMRLEDALSRVRYEFIPESAERFRIFVSGQSRTLKPVVQQQVYLIGRQALVNALRHSEATSIEAEVEYLRRRLRVVVRDNGRGIDPKAVRSGRGGDWGVARMRDRAECIGAQLRIWSRPSGGTEIEISVPVRS
jgi:signal transduction histidine kinase